MNVKTVKLTLAFRKQVESTTSFLNKLIMWFTQSKYYHVETIINDVWISSSFNRGGFSIRPLRPIDESPDSRYDYYKFDEFEMSEEQFNTIINFIKAQEGSKYDMCGIIFSQVLPFRFDSRSKWFCSEASTKILQLFLRPEVINIQPNSMSPGDLAKLYGLEK